MAPATRGSVKRGRNEQPPVEQAMSLLLLPEEVLSYLCQPKFEERAPNGGRLAFEGLTTPCFARAGRACKQLLRIWSLFVDLELADSSTWQFKIPATIPEGSTHFQRFGILENAWMDCTLKLMDLRGSIEQMPQESDAAADLALVEQAQALLDGNCVLDSESSNLRCCKAAAQKVLRLEDDEGKPAPSVLRVLPAATRMLQQAFTRMIAIGQDGNEHARKFCGETAMVLYQAYMRAEGEVLLGKAMETLEKALEVEPEHIDCWGDLASLAYIYLKQGIAGSRGVLLRALAANPSSLELREVFIEMYIDYGDLNEAEHVLDETNVALERGDVIEDSQEDSIEDEDEESPRERLASLRTQILAARATAQELP
eukprot:scaffold941_cov81-Phaeocystis_antarctica.AAC.6